MIPGLHWCEERQHKVRKNTDPLKNITPLLFGNYAKVNDQNEEELNSVFPLGFCEKCVVHLMSQETSSILSTCWSRAVYCNCTELSR